MPKCRRTDNIKLDPEALRALLGSGIELVLVGSRCYPEPSWVQALFAAEPSGGNGSSAGEAGALVETGGADRARGMLRTLGALDPYSMCFDPLALFYHLQPDAFRWDDAGAGQAGTRVPVRLTHGEEWRFERCTASQCDGYVLEPAGVSLPQYAAFLRSTGALTGAL